MAIGFPPTHSSSFALNGLQPHEFLVLAVEAAGRLGWPLRYLSASGIVAQAPDAAVQVRIEKGAARITGKSLRSELYDGGKNKMACAQFRAALDESGAIHSAESLAAGYERLMPYLTPPEADAFLQKKTGARLTDVLAIFKPASGYFITPIILDLNILLFLLMSLSGVSMISPDSASLIRWGANLRSLTLGGEWWRLLTCTFLHIGALHLAMNMLAFVLIGAQLEPRLGRWRFLFAYLLAGILASLVSTWWHGSNISAGASGAIFGMYGAFLALTVAGLVRGSNKRQLIAIVAFFVVYNLLNGLQPGIDNAAHAGGLVAGFLIGYGFVPALRRRAAQEAPKPAPEPAAPPEETYY